MYQTMAAQFLADQGQSAFAAMEFESSAMIKQTLMVGMGLALMPLSIVTEELQTGKLKRVPQEKTIPLEHGLIYRAGKELSPAVNACKEHLISYFSGRELRVSG
ncbi:hypothetical protein GCM10008018_24770 [Paenibacillus marchantiophytorum]|uniref:LysR substrate-binding domain-containing protein n=1 Tax=Paenibacillus marchantiophytorum TaxID=1619310 RepID=A0ABQ1EM60_9BACL|nr:substrate-binding domain-containing protein [Paenibacillus marchantiophytorum]GFZ78321.1 hypothetical protein GCM10008018_24770 [Paenibacillus marchantiophytorum]